MMGFIRNLRMLGCLGAIGFVSISSLVGGIYKKQQAAEQMAKYRQPTTVTCAEFERLHPTAGWYRVTDCQSNALHATFMVRTYNNDHDTSNANTSEVVIPVYAETDDIKAPAHIAVFSHDTSLVSIVNDMNKAGFFETKGKDGTDTQPSAPLDENAMIAFAKKNADRIFTTRTIEGMVKTKGGQGNDGLSEDQEKSAETGSDHIAPDSILFEEGATPTDRSNDASMEIGWGAVGTVVIGGIFLFMILAAFGRSGSGGNRGNTGGNGGGGSFGGGGGGNSGGSGNWGSTPSAPSSGGFVGQNTGQNAGPTTGQKSWSTPPTGGTTPPSQPWSR